MNKEHDSNAMEVANTKWVPPPVDPKSQFEKDQLSHSLLPPCRRLALFICKSLTIAVSNDVESMLGTAGTFAGGLLAIGNMDAVDFTRGEVAILYDIMIAHFAKSNDEWSLKISWHVDYAPSGDFADIIREFNGRIGTLREASGGPKLPRSWGVGTKCGYNARDGCAYKTRCYGADTIVIDNHGNGLKEDPWMTFYKSDDPADEEVAKKLKPICDRDLKIKFINRGICRSMGYTFEKDAVSMCQTKNWGILSHLIKTVDGNVPRKVGFEVLYHHNVCGGYSVPNIEIIEMLLDAGVPLINWQQPYLSECEPLFEILKVKDIYAVDDFLCDVKIYGGAPDSFIEDIRRKMVFSMCIYMRDTKWDHSRSRYIDKCLRIWFALNRKDDDDDRFLSEEDKERLAKVLFRRILEEAPRHGFDQSFITWLHDQI